MLQIMERCNNQKTACRRVNEGCEKIFFCLYLKKNIVITQAIIIDITLRDILIISPAFNFEKKIEWKNFQNIIPGSIQHEINDKVNSEDKNKENSDQLK